MFENASALYLSLIIIPVILLYLLRPKPKQIMIPSLILLLSFKRKKKLTSLFDTLIRDLLLLIQLLAMIIIILGIADPYYMGSARFERTIVVLDGSASMWATDVKPDRFTQGQKIADEYFGSSEKNTLILARDSPELVFMDEQSDTAITRLEGLRPKPEGTDLNEAIMSAISLMGNEVGNLIIISDFSGQDIDDVQKIIESKNIPVKYFQTGSKGSNLGIIEASIEDDTLKFVVHNYEDNSRNVLDRTIKPESNEFFSMNLKSGVSEISLLPEDDLLTDNILNISAQDTAKKRVLLLSESAGKNKPVSAAFRSIPDLEVDEFSIDLTPRKPDHDMIILFDYEMSSFLPGSMEDLKNYVHNGGVLVFMASDELPSIDTKGLLPVNVSGEAKPSGFNVVPSELTADIDFGVSKYLRGKINDGSIQLVSGKEGPIIAYRDTGDGKVFYVGINDEWGDFHLKASFPIFWYRLLKFIGPESPETDLKNYNLLDEKESNISIKKIDFTEIEKVSESKSMEKKHIRPFLSFSAILMVMLELYYLKYRGEL